MAAMVYFFIGPTAILSIVGLLHGPDKTVPTPQEDWEKAIVDVLVPTYNEQHTITLCLASLAKQTFKPRSITIIDDNSADDTVRLATEFSESIGLEINIIKRQINEGKTPSMAYMAYEKDGDVEFVLDADTFLESDNYIEEMVKELYQGVGIGSASGVVTTLNERSYREFLDSTPALEVFQSKNEIARSVWPRTWYARMGQRTVFLYREMLYLFLQLFIYRGEMTFFGSIINPMGCAVAYRRKYVKDVLDRFADSLGLDLTTAEDAFIGMSFLSQGYRNVQTNKVAARTKEPTLTKLPKQLFIWSSAFLQCCFYFNFILKTPFRLFSVYKKHRHEKNDPAHQKALERRKIKEAYRQAFGEAYTEAYGRPMGWYIFTSAFEKISFPTILLIFVLWGAWKMLFITLAAELFFFSIIVAIVSMKGRRLINVGKGILVSPLRYTAALFDLVVIVNFALDIWVRNNRKWRK